MNQNSRTLVVAGSWIAVLVFVMLLIFVGLYAFPKYAAMRAEETGAAQIRLAQLNSKMALETARDGLELAKLNAQAEMEAARGHAEAIKTIGQALAANENYLSYQWLQRMQSPTSEVIYVPTEAGMPIMEATRNLQRALSSAAAAAPPR